MIKEILCKCLCSLNVLVDDTIPELEPSTADLMQKQISARRMIYANQSFDITDIILARMNGKAG